MCWQNHAQTTDPTSAYTPDKDELDAIVQKLNSRYESFPATYWEWIVALWNSNNGDYAIDPNIKMPLYDHDTIKRHEEPKQN